MEKFVTFNVEKESSGMAFKMCVEGSQPTEYSLYPVKISIQNEGEIDIFKQKQNFSLNIFTTR